MGVASDKQASDVMLLDLRGLCSYADYFVICSGETDRQINAISQAIDEAVAQGGGRLLHQEGDAASGWALLDFGDFIVHIFQPQQREYYQLEQLWGQAPMLVRIQ